MQIDAGTTTRDVSVRQHLNSDRPFLEILLCKPGQKRVRRKAVGVKDAPSRVTELLIHRHKNSIDFGVCPGRDGVGVTRFRNVPTLWICHYITVLRCDVSIAKPTPPPIGLGVDAAQIK